jgi:hypothetical protein
LARYSGTPPFCASTIAVAVFGPMPLRSFSVFVRIRRSSSSGSRVSTTAAAVRNALTR